MKKLWSGNGIVPCSIVVLLLATTGISKEAAKKGAKTQSIGIWLGIMEHVDDAKLTSNDKKTDGDLTVMTGNFRVDKTNWRAMGHVKVPLIILNPGQTAQLSMTGKPFVLGKEPKDLSFQITPKLVGDDYSIEISATRADGMTRRTGKATVTVTLGGNAAVTLNEDAAGKKRTLIYLKVFDGGEAKLKMKMKAGEDDIAAGTIERFDFNGDGVVDKNEADQAATEMTDRMVNRGLRGTWIKYDADGDGIVDDTERAALKGELHKRLEQSTKTAKPVKPVEPGVKPVTKDEFNTETKVLKLERLDREALIRMLNKKDGWKDKKKRARDFGVVKGDWADLKKDAWKKKDK